MQDENKNLGIQILDSSLVEKGDPPPKLPPIPKVVPHQPPPTTSEKIMVEMGKHPITDIYLTNKVPVYKPSNLHFPYPIYMQHQRYWKSIFQYIVSPGASFSKSVTVTNGTVMSTTNGISAELGVSYSGFSAKVSAYFEKTITVSASTSSTTATSYKAPEDGGTKLYIVWQLMNELSFADKNGNSFSFGKNFPGDPITMYDALTLFYKVYAYPLPL